MDIKQGDIITLENGDRVKVSLEVLPKQVIKLVEGKEYRLKRSGEFCHFIDTKGTHLDKEISTSIFTYLGEVDSQMGRRRIFFRTKGTAYSMWGMGSLDFVVEEVK
jgi:hypothetical protein